MNGLTRVSRATASAIIGGILIMFLTCMLTSPEPLPRYQIYDVGIVFLGAGAVMTPLFMGHLAHLTNEKIVRTDKCVAGILIVLCIGAAVILGILRFI